MIDENERYHGEELTLALATLSRLRQERGPVVVNMSSSRVTEDQYYVNEQSVVDAVRLKSQFNVWHPHSGLKIDFITLTDSAFDRSSRDRRRQVAALPERTVSFASPEDVILKKMVYFQEGGSEKHLRDIASVIRIQGSALAAWLASSRQRRRDRFDERIRRHGNGRGRGRVGGERRRGRGWRIGFRPRDLARAFWVDRLGHRGVFAEEDQGNEHHQSHSQHQA